MPYEPERRRFFVEDLSAEPIMLTGGEAHHAANVLRLKVGAEVELFDGRGGRALGRITQVRRSEVTVEVTHRLDRPARPQPVVHLGFAVPKGKRLDWLLEKATELGAASLRPVAFERSVAGEDDLSGHKQQRWQQHCVAAAKQCGLDFLPELAQVQAAAEFAAHARSAGWLSLVGDPGEACVPLRAALDEWAPGWEIALLVGPEGGLTDAERHVLAEAGFAAVRLGSTTLRIETAAVALLAAVTAMCGTEYLESR